MTRIRWEPTKHGGWTGHVGTAGDWLFQVWLADTAAAGWQLDSTLSGQFGSGWHRCDGDPEKLKAEAERWLEEFITSLGAVFPDDPGTMFADVMDEESFRAQFDPGCYLRYTDRDAGWPGERDYARKYLTPGAAYRIAWSDIGQSKTSIGLAGVEGAFNSVLFEPVDDPATAAPATGEKE